MPVRRRFQSLRSCASVRLHCSLLTEPGGWQPRQLSSASVSHSDSAIRPLTTHAVHGTAYLSGHGPDLPLTTDNYFFYSVLVVILRAPYPTQGRNQYHSSTTQCSERRADYKRERPRSDAGFSFSDGLSHSCQQSWVFVRVLHSGTCSLACTSIAGSSSIPPKGSTVWPSAGAFASSGSG